MFQTWWDVNQQIVRKVIDSLSGLVGGWLIAQGEWGAAIAPAVVLAGNFVWFWINNRTKATVAGLEASTLPGTSTVAATLDRMIVEEEKKEK